MKKLAAIALLLLPMSSYATSFTCKALNEGNVDATTQKVLVHSTVDVEGKRMRLNLNGVPWRLDFIGQKQIAKMYANNEGTIAVNYIDNGVDAVFIMHVTSNDGSESKVYTLSLCSES